MAVELDVVALTASPATTSLPGALAALALSPMAGSAGEAKTLDCTSLAATVEVLAGGQGLLTASSAVAAAGASAGGAGLLE